MGARTRGPHDGPGSRYQPTTSVPSVVRGLRLAAAAVGGYLAGTVPSADIAARAATGGQTDLRRSGTGNPGAANAIAVLGASWGYAVMAADIAKGAVACGVGRRVAG